MFDEAPNNLPVEDILENVETAPVQTQPTGSFGVQTRPRPPVFAPVGTSQAPQQIAMLETPSGGARRVILFVGISVVALLLFVGGGWLLLRVVLKKQTNVSAVPVAQTNTNEAVPAVNAGNTAVPTTFANTPVTNTAAPAVPVTEPPANIPPPIAPTLKDTDADGLNDTQEIGIGTKPSVTDSDSDGLNDFEEVRQWKTDPLNPDTDGDGYTDGGEVGSGYSPTGPGKIQRAP